MFKNLSFLPREEKFYRYLESLAALSLESAKSLKNMVESRDSAARKSAHAAILDTRLKAKSVSAEVTRELCLTFVTPFEREDIQDFTKELYKIPKTIEKVANYLELHNMSGISDLSGQINLITLEAEAMKNMVSTLIKGGKADQVIREAAVLDNLENEGDKILSALLVDLLKDTSDVRQLILRKDLYDMLERVIDRYRNAAGIALQMVLKHT